MYKKKEEEKEKEKEMEKGGYWKDCDEREKNCKGRRRERERVLNFKNCILQNNFFFSKKNFFT